MRLYLVFFLLLLNLVARPAHSESDWLYSVRPGDNLWNLCNQYTVRRDCWLKLGEYNSVEYPRQLPPGLIIRFPISWLKEVPRPVTLSYYKGDVTVFYQDPASSEIPTFQQKLAIGTTVVTGEESFATLIFEDGALIQMEPNSELLLDSISTTQQDQAFTSQLHLNTGAVNARVPERRPKSRFQIRTPSAIAAVRGTEYRLTAGKNENSGVSITEVLEGTVGVDAQQSTVDVEEGFSVKTAEGLPPEQPKPLLSAPEFAAAVKDIQPGPIELKWQPVDGAEQYRLDSLKDNEQAELINSYFLSSAEFSLDVTDFNDDCVRFAVRGVDADGVQGLVAYKRICIEQPLDSPAVIAKPKLSKPDLDVEIDWQMVEAADSYFVQVSNSDNFDVIYQEFTTTETSLVLPWDPSFEKGLYYRVQAIALEGVDSEFSQTREIKVDRLPKKALLTWSVFWVLFVAL